MGRCCSEARGHRCGPGLWRSRSAVGTGETEAEPGSGSGAHVTRRVLWSWRASTPSGQCDGASVPPAPETLTSARWPLLGAGGGGGAQGWLRGRRPRPGRLSFPPAPASKLGFAGPQNPSCPRMGQSPPQEPRGTARKRMLTRKGCWASAQPASPPVHPTKSRWLCGWPRLCLPHPGAMGRSCGDTDPGSECRGALWGQQGVGGQVRAGNVSGAPGPTHKHPFQAAPLTP